MVDDYDCEVKGVSTPNAGALWVIASADGRPYMLRARTFREPVRSREKETAGPTCPPNIFLDAKVTSKAVARALSNTTQAAVVTRGTAPWDIVGCNSAWVELCGFAPEEALGKTPVILQGECTDLGVARAFTQTLKDGAESGENSQPQSHRNATNNDAGV